MLTKQAYLADPCRASSLPYWKACRIVPPPGIVLIHEEDFTPANYPDCQDEPYFRLRHNLKAVPAPQLPEGFSPALFPCRSTPPISTAAIRISA